VTGKSDILTILMSTGPRGVAWRMTVIAGLAVIARLPLAIWFPVLSPDGEGYVLVAQNLLQNGCISISDPVGGVCVPHWGGNHPPAYPILLALVGGSIPALLFLQILLFSMAAARLTGAIENLLRIPNLALAIGVIVALSPIQVGWGRFVLPDLLSSAATIWLFAELASSFGGGRLRILPIGLCLVAATFLRYDGVFLAIPVAVAGFWLHPPAQALRKGLIIAIIIAIPISGWLARGVAVGLGPVPEQRFMQDGSRTPDGYRAWGRTWIRTLYQGAAFGYPVPAGRYSEISIPDLAYDNDAERKQVSALLIKLSSQAGQPFPIEIDNAFAELAKDRRNRNPIRTFAVLPLLRAGSFWLNPFYSFGLPGIELDGVLSSADRMEIANGSISNIILIAQKYPVPVIGKAGLAVYRYLLVGLFLGCLFTLMKRRKMPENGLVLSIVSFVVFRTGVLSYHSSIDSRYMIGAMAAAEIAVVICAGKWVLARRKNHHTMSEEV
jgi:hypothetical protein